MKIENYYSMINNKVHYIVITFWRLKITIKIGNYYD